MARSACVIQYEGAFRLPVPPEDVWTTIERVDRYEAWWSWLSDFRLDGGGLRTGAVLSGVVVPPLPYRMRLRIDLEECERPSQIRAAVHGDLEGGALLLLDPDGGGTMARVVWTIEMMQRPMRLAARVAYPLLRWGHDRVVETTVNSFRRQLVAGRL
jgi:carbon monoxide dehydrogenase subunit G